MSLTPSENAAATRLTTGAPTGYNNGVGDPVTNPYGMAGRTLNYLTNLFGLSADVTLLGQAAAREANDSANSAAVATTKAGEASTAAAAATAAASTMITTGVTGAITIGIGSRTLTGAGLANKSYFRGQTLVWADEAAPSTKRMVGQVTAYTNSGASSSLTIDATESKGASPSGTWTIGPTAASGSSGALINWNTINATTTLVSGQGYFVDTSVASFSVNLPSSPTPGATVWVRDAKRTWKSKPLTLIGMVEGDVNEVLDIDGFAAQLVYIDSTVGWSYI